MKPQTNLFGEQEGRLSGRKSATHQPITIVIPQKQDYTRWTKQLNHCTLDCLRPMATALASLLQKHEVTYTEQGKPATMPPAVQRGLLPGNKPKGVLIDFVALFLEPSNFMHYFNSLSPQLQELWRTTFLKGRLTANEANKLAGEKVFAKVREWYDTRHALSPKLAGWFEVFLTRKPGTSLYGNYLYEGMLSLNQSYTQHLIPAIFGGVTGQEQGLDTLPADSKLLTFCGEDSIFALLPTITVLRETNALEQNQNGRMALSGLKTAAKRLGMSEFLPDSPDASSAMLRAQMVLNVVGNAVQRDQKKLPQEEKLVKSAITSASKMDSFILAVVLPDITGLRAALMPNSSVTDVVNAFFSTLCDTDNQQWRPFDALLVETMVNNSKLNFQLFSSYDYEHAKVVNKYGAKDVPYADIREQITLPLLRGYAFLLAALGLVEIAYHRPRFGNASPYDGLQYVRVTELGRYCAGRIKQYTPKGTSNKQYFEADTDQLLIKSLDDDNPLLPLVKTMADPITQRLYKVSFGSFLADCSTSDDIDSRIGQFKRYVCAKPAPVWTKFFAEVRRRFKPFSTVSTKYSLARIPADNKELQRILLTDPVIRKYTVKAEGYLLLIETAHQAKVREQLKTYGYVM